MKINGTQDRHRRRLENGSVWFILYFFIAVFCVWQSNGSPEKLCPQNCTCTSMPDTTTLVNCQHLHLRYLPADIESKVGALDLGYNDFRAIPSNISAFTNLMSLDMRHNKISGLDANSFQGMEDMNRLILSYNAFKRFTDIHPLSLRGAVSILRLDLSNNRLRGIPPLQSPTLLELDLNNCSLTVIHQDSIRGMPHLFSLQLALNHIHVINQYIRHPNLVIMNLTKSEVSTISISTWNSLPSLEHLILSKNYELKSFHTNSSSLMILEMNDCNLESVPKCALGNLTYLDLSGNHIRKIEKDAFSQMKRLRTLMLVDNSIDYVDRVAFFDLLELEELDASHNTIRVLDPHSFMNNKYLTSVKLSRNYFNELIRFQSTSIATLDLKNCEITKVTWDCLTGMTKLLELYLSGNMFTTLPGNLSSETLHTLYASNCKLTTLKNTTLKNLPQLKTLNIVGNRLVEFHVNDFTRLHILKLSDNPWRCECEKKSFEFLYAALSSRLSDVKFARCHSPENLEGKTWLEACESTWGANHKNEKTWVISISVAILFAIACCSFVHIKRTIIDKRQRRQEMEASANRERLLSIINATTASVQQRRENADLNAPDPRDLQRPPSYTDAIAMPALGSMTSLASPKTETRSTSTTRSTPSGKHKVRRKKRGDRRRSQVSLGTDNTPLDSNSPESNELSKSTPELLTLDRSLSPERKTRRRRRRSTPRSRGSRDCVSTNSTDADSSMEETHV